MKVTDAQVIAASNSYLQCERGHHESIRAALESLHFEAPSEEEVRQVYAATPGHIVNNPPRPDPRREKIIIILGKQGIEQHERLADAILKALDEVNQMTECAFCSRPIVGYDHSGCVLRSAPIAAGTGMGPDGIALIQAERQRQVESEKWTPQHDDMHTTFELSRAAVCYVFSVVNIYSVVNWWPWEWSWWKPSDDPIRNLVKAGALIAAEIDRLQRASNPTPSVQQETI